MSDRPGTKTCLLYTSIAGSVNVGVSIASAAIGTVGAPVLIVGGLALVGYELLRD